MFKLSRNPLLYPDEMRVRNWLFDHFKAAAVPFGFEEYDAPILETEELYRENKEKKLLNNYTPFEDKGGKSHKTEMTHL